MAGFRCAKCGKVAMAQKMCCGRPMKKSLAARDGRGWSSRPSRCW